MRTLHALASLSREAVLVGPVTMTRDWPSRSPKLVVRAWCPACKARHPLDWAAPAPYRLETVEHAVMPEGCELAGDNALVAPDPDLGRENAEVVRHFVGRLRAWRKELELAGRLADGPAIGSPVSGEMMVPSWT